MPPLHIFDLLLFFLLDFVTWVAPKVEFNHKIH